MASPALTTRLPTMSDDITDAKTEVAYYMYLDHFRLCPSVH